jgi:hypothetical protein
MQLWKERRNFQHTQCLSLELFLRYFFVAAQPIQANIQAILMAIPHDL